MKLRHVILLMSFCITIALADDWRRQNEKEQLPESQPAVTFEMVDTETHQQPASRPAAD